MTNQVLLKQTMLMTLGLSVLSVAGWFLTLSGPHRRLHQAERTIFAQEERLADLGTASPDAAARTNAYESRIASVSRVLAETPPADALYDAIQKAATAAHVHVERLEPQSNSRRVMDLTKNAGRTVEPVAFEIQAKGDFASIAAFTDLMERSLGLTRLTTLKILPAEDATRKHPTVVLHLTSTHYVTSPAAKPDATPPARRENR